MSCRFLRRGCPGNATVWNSVQNPWLAIWLLRIRWAVFLTWRTFITFTSGFFSTTKFIAAINCRVDIYVTGTSPPGKDIMWLHRKNINKSTSRKNIKSLYVSRELFWVQRLTSKSCHFEDYEKQDKRQMTSK